MSSKIEYISFGKEIDGTQYCSAVETQAENLIENNEEDAVLVFPAKDKWSTLRTKGYKLTTENAAAILPLAIYKIKKFVLKPLVDIATYKVEITVYDNVGGYEVPKTINVPLTSFVDENGDNFQDLDITEMIVTANEWQALPLSNGFGEYKVGKYKDNTFFYEENSNEILFAGTEFRIGSSIIGGIFADNSPVYKRLLDWLDNKVYNYKYTYPSSVSNLGIDQVFLLGDLTGFGNIVPINTDVRNLQYRIEYIPLSSKTKLRARKAAETTQEYVQPFNQRAEINAVSAFGKNMYVTAQKTGAPEIKVVKNYKDLSKIPPLGALVRHNGKLYRLVANSYNLYNTVFIQVTHTLSENWENRSKHVAVDQKYRNWNIPQDILWRNLYYEDYLICSSNPINPTFKGAIETKYVTGVLANSYYKKPITYMAWFFQSKTRKDEGVVIPVSTYGTANSLVFTAKFNDALSAGLSKVADGSDYCEEALYCLQNGKLTSATVILTSGIGVGLYDFDSGEFTKTEVSNDNEVLLSASECYPRIMRNSHVTLGEHKLNAPIDELFRVKFKILKDPGEALKFTYQIHITPSVKDVGKIIIGNKFAEINTLITRQKPSEYGLKVVYLNKYLRDGEDKVLDGIVSDYGVFSTDYLDGNTQLLINKITNTDIKAWAVVDKDYNLIIGRNDTERTIYFSMSHNKL